LAATASVMMRAFRAANSSFFTWRAGAYDPTMSDAVGDQAPPFPIIDYSDHVLIGTIGGPLARTDPEAFLLAGLGTPGVPVTFTTAGVVETPPGVDCRDFESISLWVVVTAAPTTPAVVSVRSLWSNMATVSASADIGIQASDDSISAGISPQNGYTAEYAVTGTTVAVGVALGPYNVPVRGRRHLFGVESDTNDVEGYVLAMRMA